MLCLERCAIEDCTGKCAVRHSEDDYYDEHLCRDHLADLSNFTPDMDQEEAPCWSETDEIEKDMPADKKPSAKTISKNRKAKAKAKTIAKEPIVGPASGSSEDMHSFFMWLELFGDDH